MKTILKQLEPANIPLEKQVDLLAQFLLENFEEDIGNNKSAGEGAIEMAVRLLTQLKKESKPSEEGKSFRELVIWIADYSYRKANPKGKMDTPSIVYEQVEKDFGKFYQYGKLTLPNKKRG